ncbi:MAG: hypothetical protein V1924_02445 [Candidatus Bathyarchaeota archaeon]
MKRLFHLVPTGSSNKAAGESYARMRPHRWTLPLLLMLALVVVAPLAVNASPALSVSTSARHVYVAPGGFFTVEGDSEPGLNITVCLKATNNDTYVYLFKVPGDGHYKLNVALPQSMGSDVYRVTVETNGTLKESLMVTVSSSDRNQVAAQLLQSTWSTLEGLRAYVAELESKGYTVPPRVVEGAQKAQQALKEAQRLLDSGRLEESWAKVKEAQGILRGSFQAIDQPDRPPVAEPPTAAMNQTLTRAREYFKKLSLSVKSLRERGWDTSSLEDTLEEIESLLRDAERQYRDRDQSGFEATMRQAAQRLKDAQALVNAEMNRVKVALASRYRENIQSRVTNLRESLSAYQSTIPTVERTRVTYALTLTDDKLAQLQRKLAAGELDLDELVDVSDDIKAALQNVSNEDIRRALEEMNVVRARVDTLNQAEAQRDDDAAETWRSKLQAESLRLRRIREYLSSLSSPTNRP